MYVPNAIFTRTATLMLPPVADTVTSEARLPLATDSLSASVLVEFKTAGSELRDDDVFTGYPAFNKLQKLSELTKSNTYLRHSVFPTRTSFVDLSASEWSQQSAEICSYLSVAKALGGLWRHREQGG